MQSPLSSFTSSQIMCPPREQGCHRSPHRYSNQDTSLNDDRYTNVRYFTQSNDHARQTKAQDCRLSKLFRCGRAKVFTKSSSLPITKTLFTNRKMQSRRRHSPKTAFKVYPWRPRNRDFHGQVQESRTDRLSPRRSTHPRP